MKKILFAIVVICSSTHCSQDPESVRIEPVPPEIRFAPRHEIFEPLNIPAEEMNIIAENQSGELLKINPSLHRKLQDRNALPTSGNDSQCIALLSTLISIEKSRQQSHIPEWSGVCSCASASPENELQPVEELVLKLHQYNPTMFWQLQKTSNLLRTTLEAPALNLLKTVVELEHERVASARKSLFGWFGGTSIGGFAVGLLYYLLH